MKNIELATQALQIIERKKQLKDALDTIKLNTPCNIKTIKRF